MVTWATLNVCHPNTVQCTKGAERKQYSLLVEEIKAGMERALQASVWTLNLVTSFKYLGQVLTASDNDWTGVVDNLRKAQFNWDRMSRILVRGGGGARAYVNFYKSVVRSVLLFIS